MSTDRNLRSRTRLLSTAPAVEGDFTPRGTPEPVDDDVVDDFAARDLMVPGGLPSSRSSSDGEEDLGGSPDGDAMAQASDPTGPRMANNSHGRPSGDRRAAQASSQDELANSVHSPEENTISLNSDEVRDAMQAVSESKAKVETLLPFMEAILARLEQLEGLAPEIRLNHEEQFHSDSENGDEILETQAGPSDKGKGTDPREWGGVNIPDSELDIEAQRVRFAEIAREQNNIGITGITDRIWLTIQKLG
ncbi:hypothetical protein BDZ97DRAFT_2004345 [Flammula alnicola]|nr:hypothetical protein BDZ97DRAFT_2004345 [Flammula alnicola]